MLTKLEIIDKFNMQAHPEGGWYAEVYRSNLKLENLDRSLMTSIYFLLDSDSVSKFHQIKSDELWFFHFGSPLIVHSLNDIGYSTFSLGNDLSKGENPQYVVPANTIFGSSVSDLNSFSLVSCVVAPGFDFRDFKLFTKEELLKVYPKESEIIIKLT